MNDNDAVALTSSRPAPPSPAVSRRASRTPSRPVSGVRPPRPHTPSPILIRDFGFPHADPRFSGHGPNVPRPNRPTILARRLAGSSSLAPSDPDDDDEYDDDERTADAPKVWDTDDPHGWRGLWAGRPWGIPGDFPSRGDLDRNFGAEDGDVDDDDDDGEGDEDMDLDRPDPPLHPGIYRALFAFEPEGTAEMRLDEDQLVRVVGRGGGVGWAVVVKDALGDTGAHALVPESYLEVIRLDSEDEDIEC